MDRKVDYRAEGKQRQFCRKAVSWQSSGQHGDICTIVTLVDNLIATSLVSNCIVLRFVKGTGDEFLWF